MGLSVRLRGPGDRVRPIGGGRFDLHPDAGTFTLPQLELAPVGDGPAPRLLSLRADVRASDRALADAVAGAWRADELAGQVIAGPTASAQPRPVRVRPGPTEADRTVVVTWHGSYDTDSHPAEEFELTVDLRFHPDPGPSGTEPSAAPHPGLVAIDFGTSNSTVVLFDQNKHFTRPLARRQAARLRDDLVALVLDRSLPEPGATRFDELLARVARAVAPGRADDPREAVAAALRATPVGNPRKDPVVLYDVLLGLERELGTRPQPLRSWLTVRLHRCYENAFGMPGLDGLQLFPVELDQVTGSEELPSRIVVEQVSPLRVRMAADDGKLADSGNRAHIGLKQHLGRPEPREVGEGRDRATVSTDDLIKAGLGFLVDQSDAYIADNQAMLARGRLNHAVITYPTIAPPGVRHGLRALLLDQLGGPRRAQVDASYDEAIAAVMFFLMRDLGGEYEVGVEAVKTRYHRLSDTAWAQNVLVIDIGGGTTDVALVTMTLEDRTVAEPGADPQWYGRYYVLTPQVRGSTGNLQLGGEYLTLLVFKWLKATVADLLLTRPDRDVEKVRAMDPKFRDGQEYRPGSLVAAVLDDDEDEKALGFVDAVVPTRWADDPAHEQTFWLLWQLAERAKLALGAPGASAFPISVTDLRQVRNAIATATGEALPELSDATAELAVEDFDQLVARPLTEVMQLATDLVAGRFKDSPEARLDRIILTGKTTGLAQVRRALSTSFGKGINWDATGVTVEDSYAKLATAIGACWAESIRQYAFDPEGARRQLREGKTVLDVDVDNLFFTLPCTFAYREQQGIAERIPGGEQLYQLDADNIGKARSDDHWADQLTEAVTVYRVVDGKDGIDWGTFKYREYANEHEPDAELDPAVWPVQIRTQLEVTQDLDLSIHLCRGRPHLVVDGPSVDVLDVIRDVFGPGHLSEDGRLPAVLPGDILVDSLIAGSTSRGNNVVFPAGEPLEFAEVFVDGDGPGAALTPGLLAATDLGLPGRRRADDATGGWVFTLRFDGGQQEIGRLARPTLGGGRFPTRYRVSLDAAGRLRVHAGAIPYRRAATLREVEEPGRVFTRQLVPVRPAHDHTRNPFNGMH